MSEGGTVAAARARAARRARRALELATGPYPARTAVLRPRRSLDAAQRARRLHRASTSDAAGVIVETEAYHDSEPACHAYVGLTPRTPGALRGAGTALRLPLLRHPRAAQRRRASREGVGAAVLIRALEPLEGLARDARCAAGGRAPVDLCSGPGQADPGARHRARSTTTRACATGRSGSARRRAAGSGRGSSSGRGSASRRPRTCRGASARRTSIHVSRPWPPEMRRQPLARAGQPRLVGEHDRLRAVAQPELREQPRDVRLHRRLLDDEQLRRSRRWRGPARRARSTSSSRGVSSSSASGVAGGAGRRARSSSTQPPGDGRREQRVARRDHADRRCTSCSGPTSLSRKPLAPAASAS